MNRWQEIYGSAAYRRMVAGKIRAVCLLTAFFIVYYFSLPILVGYWPEVMARPLLGKVNGAYLLAFSQFLMAWGVAFAYMRFAGRFDLQAASILAQTDSDSARGE
ncbi:MAG: DUF485 domain-containing protein [Bryobacterales bacterium]|nr:DUF485 domain-containing protein [Bryobacterales bacterium]